MKSPGAEIKATEPKLVVVSKKAEATESHVKWKYFAPIVVAAALALAPAPAGLPQHAWYYFALFAGVIVGLMLEPLAWRSHWCHRRHFGDAPRAMGAL